MWFWYALAAALVAAIEVVLNKRTLKKVGAPLLTWSMFAFSIPFFAIYVFFNRPTRLPPLFFTGALVSSLFFVFAKTATNEAIKQSSLSKIFPLNSLGTLFTYLFGLIILAEAIKLPALLGLMTILLGTYLLNVEKAHEGLLEPFKLLLRERHSAIFIAAMILASLSGIFDKIALTNTQPVSPIPALLAENLFMSLVLGVYLTRKQGGWLKELKNNFWVLGLNGLVYGISNIFTFLAFIDGAVALAGGVKKLQILFVLLLSLIFFKDRPPKHVWLATLILILGTVIIKLFS